MFRHKSILIQLSTMVNGLKMTFSKTLKTLKFEKVKLTSSGLVHLQTSEITKLI